MPSSVAEQLNLPAATPTVVLATAHPAKFPHTLTGEWPTCRHGLSTLMTDQERITHLPNDAARIEAYVAAQRAAGTRGAGMTAEMTRLSNGMRVVTQHMPHVETASLGV